MNAGMTAEQDRKKAATFDKYLADEVMQWIRKILELGGVELSKTIIPVEKEEDVTNMLKDGKVLCNVANIIQPNALYKINTGAMAFKKMENISWFLEWCTSYGCKHTDMFHTVDLYEGSNIPQVINGINALGRRCQVRGFAGPILVVKEATENTRAGSNKGASQAGLNFDKTRPILMD